MISLFDFVNNYYINNILLNLIIALAYYFIFNNLFFQYIKHHLYIIGNQFFNIALLKSALACYFIMNNLSFYCSFDFYLSTFYLLGLIYFY